MNVSLKISRSINKLNYKILDKVFIHSKHVEYIYIYTHTYTLRIMMTIVGYDLILWMKLQIRVFFFLIKIKINGLKKKTIIYMMMYENQ